jgi:exodeoxyribonuclease-5
MSKVEYTNDQKETKGIFSKWIKNPEKQVLQIGGYAGTGKTTIIADMINDAGLDMDDEVLAMAYTGRAASNLSQKGIPASSMHSGLMDFTQIPKLDENHKIIKRDGRIVYEWKMSRKVFLPKSIKLIVVDEGSFVDTIMGKIAEAFGIPIYVTGDPKQLGPIYGKSHWLNNPDYMMTDITRQGKDSGIIELATRIRLGKELPNKKYRFKDDCFVFPKKMLTDEVLKHSDIVICGTNKTRNYFNRRIREDILGIHSKLPIRGDKLICKHNYWNRVLGGVPLTNGIIGSVVHGVTMDDIDLPSNTIRIDFRPEHMEYDFFTDLPISIDYFQEPCGAHEDKSDIFQRGIKMELGHAITTHISQGSQWPSVCFWDEPFGNSDFTERIRYTGVTRAEQYLSFWM